ncbi:ABC transporter substrate-binding protein [uncultured Agrobacterium sp.]|uniref:ABC transporter substrate-binding protein n=1 Tax=uncultured Agrobacterium sp. TaxID=157277 RepID=UPI0025E294A2|nr:ABC transporter substrate-binding protein [uncultured Agrobacterium sp.]
MARLTRRTFVSAVVSLAAAGQVRAMGREPRVATLDWALLETLLAIGANVVAATELRQFMEVVVKPDLPSGVVDIGLRGTPNFEALQFAQPDLIFNSNFYAWADPFIGRIAPVESHSIYVTGKSPYALAEQATLAIGERLAIPAAQDLVTDLAVRLDHLKQAFTAGESRPVLPINLGDARHYRVFGSDSMFGEVLTRLGLSNAWQGATNYSATAPLGIETLASMPDAWLVLIPPHPQDVFEALTKSAFWKALPAVRESRVLTVGSINPYGALPAARRFAEFLAKGLSGARG